MSEEREAFEAWAVREFGFDRCDLVRDGDGYAVVGIDNAYDGWQAALEWQAARQSAGATGQEPFGWAIRIGDSDMWSYTKNESDADFYGKQSGLKYEKRQLYAAPIGDNGAKDCCQGRAPSHECWEECGGTKRRAQPAESKRVELTEGQVIEAIQKACGEYRHGCSYSFEDVWNCIEAALLARAQVKGE